MWLIIIKEFMKRSVRQIGVLKRLKLKSKYSQKLNLNRSFLRSNMLQQDLLAQSRIPSDAPTNLIACEVTGDGNCLYYTISMSLVGTTEYSTILRILTVIELFENANYYGNHPRFGEAHKCFPCTCTCIRKARSRL